VKADGAAEAGGAFRSPHVVLAAEMAVGTPASGNLLQRRSPTAAHATVKHALGTNGARQALAKEGDACGGRASSGEKRANLRLDVLFLLLRDSAPVAHGRDHLRRMRPDESCRRRIAAGNESVGCIAAEKACEARQCPISNLPSSLLRQMRQGVCGAWQTWQKEGRTGGRTGC